MANGRRIAMTKEMLKYPCTNGELAATLGIPEPTVSRNLMILQRGGVIQGKRAGNSVVFSVVEPEFVQKLLDHLLFE